MRIDYTYVDNIVLGHLLLEAELWNENPGACGEAFYISNEEPIRAEDFWRTYSEVVSPVRMIPTDANVLRVIGYAVEQLQRVSFIESRLHHQLRLLAPPAFIMTNVSYGVSCGKARRVLRYEPAFTMEQGLQRAVREYEAKRIIVGSGEKKCSYDLVLVGLSFHSACGRVE